jgi:N-sulfoglucosamine sulfohydrolase
VNTSRGQPTVPESFSCRWQQCRLRLRRCEYRLPVLALAPRGTTVARTCHVRVMVRALQSLLILLCLGFFTNTVGAASRPNLLLITVDDMSADSVGVFGSRVPEITPNIDKLAAQGMRFDRAHVQVANCMPSRNVMWSGRYPQSNKVEGFYQVRDPGYPLLVDVAKSAGYFTGIYHKVKDSTPYSPYGWDAVIGSSADGYHAKDANSYALATAEGIRSAKSAGKPFFLLINIADPHVPFFGLNRAGERIDDPYAPSRQYGANEIAVPGFLVDDPVVRQELARYYSSVRRADDAVGKILLALEASGEADKTIVMFLSDHGMPFPFAKTQLYHQSTRTPLIFRWPGVTKAGSVEGEHMVSAVDLLPTLVEGIGGELPQGVQGRSFLPLLKSEPQAARDRVFKAHNESASGQRTPMRAVETARFLYIFNPWSNGTRAMTSATSATSTYKRMLELAEDDPQLAGRLHFLRHRVLEEFYDIQRDPDCLANLVDDPAYQQDINMLRASLANWMHETQDPVLTAFTGRNDPQVVAQFMGQQELATEQRKAWIRAIGENMKKSRAPTQEKP